MDDMVAFGSTEYWIFALVLAGSRGMDFLSTWVATPTLALEANPIAKRLGWKMGIAVNAAVCVVLALWPVPAVVIATTSLLIAARNFKSAWWMRSMGEINYLIWVAELYGRAGKGLFIGCLAGETGLTALVGAAVLWSGQRSPLAAAVGVGIIAYAAAVAFYSLLSISRISTHRR